MIYNIVLVQRWERLLFPETTFFHKSCFQYNLTCLIHIDKFDYNLQFILFTLKKAFLKSSF